MTIKDFVIERTNIFYPVYFELIGEVNKRKEEPIDDDLETMYVTFDDGRYSIGCYQRDGLSIWDESNKDQDPIYWEFSRNILDDVSNMLKVFIQYCYYHDERYKELREEEDS